jgi:3-oxoadipate enol-lactonase
VDLGQAPVKRADVAGMTIAYVDVGHGEPLLMLHGGDGDKYGAETVVKHLPDGLRAISYDQRDSGETINEEGAYTFQTLAGDAIGLLDSLGIQKAHVFGESYGGMLALQVAAHHPDRVQSLIACTAAYSFTNMREETDAAREILTLTPEQRRSHMIEGCLSPAGQKDSALVAVLDRAMTGTAAPGSMRMLAVAEHDMTDLARRISAPTLLIYGEDDPFVRPDHGYRLAKEISEARVDILKSARHALSLEFPAATARLAADWILTHPLES